MSYKANPKLLGQLQTCEEQGIPWAIIIGQSELEKGVVKLRHVSSRQEEEIERSKLADVLKQKLNKDVWIYEIFSFICQSNNNNGMPITFKLRGLFDEWPKFVYRIN